MGNLTRVTRDQPSHSKLQSITAVVKSADKHLAVTIQLALILILINRLQLIDVPAFYSGFALLLFGGFIIHQFLPLPWRLPFFSLLSITGIFIVLGVVQSLWLLGVGLLLIMLCHLPIPFKSPAGLAGLARIGAGVGTSWPYPGSLVNWNLANNWCHVHVPIAVIPLLPPP